MVLSQSLGYLWLGHHFLRCDHSRPQSPSFLGHVVGKRGVSRVALGTRMRCDKLILVPMHASYQRVRLLWVMSVGSFYRSNWEITGRLKLHVPIFSLFETHHRWRTGLCYQQRGEIPSSVWISLSKFCRACDHRDSYYISRIQDSLYLLRN